MQLAEREEGSNMSLLVCSWIVMHVRTKVNEKEESRRVCLRY